MDLPFLLSIYWGVGIWEKLAISAIFLHFLEAEKAFDIQIICRIGMRDFFR